METVKKEIVVEETTVEKKESQEQLLAEIGERFYNLSERGLGSMESILSDFTITRNTTHS